MTHLRQRTPLLAAAVELQHFPMERSLGVVSSSPQELGTEAVATLLVKHLPDALPLETLKRLFSHYGASDIRPCVAAKMKNCAFIDFKEEAQASRAQSQLHRLRFLGKILAVERAKPNVQKSLKELSAQSHASVSEIQKEQQKIPSSVGHFETGTTVTGLKNEPIAPSLGIDYPFPPHLEYAYPPPDGNILTNIVNALIAVPRFYTQVLHLMNKMNLPAPFRPALPTPPLPPAPPEPTAPYPDRELSSDESELESSEEVGKSEDVSRDTDQSKVKRKNMVENIGEPMPKTLVPAERPMIKKRRPVLQINITSKGHQKEKEPGVSAVPDHNEVEEKDLIAEEESKGSTNSITREELIAGKMPANELFALPVFKNYTRGTPTPVLYLKNLAKDVTQEDLRFIFGAVFDNCQDLKPQLGIKLMQEGRMRGQAFVTFPSSVIAEEALNLVHGFMLKGKPMVVQFGRNPAVVKGN